MSQSLCFNDFTFSTVTRDNQPWFKSSELARALGYSSEKAVANIYRRNEDEFSNDMSVVINSSTTGIPVMTRIFSLRGCHLLAMFARTPVAKAFRKWVLDVIEQYGDRVPVEPSSLPDESPSFPGSVSVTPSTVEDRKPLRALVNAWAHVSAQPFNVCWTQLKAAFRLTDIRDLPQEWIPDALAWGQEKIDALSAVPTPTRASALPASNVYADRVKALTEFERRFMEFSVETRTRLSELNAEYIRLNQGAYAAMLGLIPSIQPGSKDSLIDALASQSYDAYNWIDEGLQRMRQAIIAARAANRVLSGRS